MLMVIAASSLTGFNPRSCTRSDSTPFKPLPRLTFKAGFREPANFESF